MLDMEGAGEQSTGLRATDTMPADNKLGDCGESAGLGTAEPRSETVQQLTAGGVEAACWD
jgi:hypothetical protein